MNELEVLDVGKDAIFTLIRMIMPVLGVALLVGLTISLFQALTQMQEVTLSFVPKIIAVFLSLAVFLPYMLTTLLEFSNRQVERIVGL
ncbi:MAG: flagellar biosynthesis protein FliQ [Alphaproteobacteria bacterium]|jgi:flagellar biosynthetic protein FliQ|nr:flagellar biosynthesis protein FliQ [Alphaproteobacteria bacterium]MDP6518190.1 flagellar biosynthesis protein FliQ [Alphaproteobacteria bacterium]|tara:strand:+ start:159 stop:422 length:264 start_codon:yes stop_codon:yes gene_type:complete